MQTLGISGSTPQAENFLKRLFWPSIRSRSDVDTLGSQGYWICAIVAAIGFLTTTLAGHPLIGVLLLLYYYLGGVGVREQSRYAGLAVFAMFAMDTVVSPSVLKVLACAVLLSVLRATFIAASWKSQAGEGDMPIRFNETWGDKFADTLPARIWPKAQIAHYFFSAALLALITLGLATAFLSRHARIH